MKEKVLVLGGTGAMGVYTVPELLARGYQVDVVSMDDWKMANKNVRYIQANGFDDDFLKGLLETEHYDAIIDYMLYNTDAFSKRVKMLLSNTRHYIFLSTYRIYSSDEVPIRETSPRLLESRADDAEYQSHDKDEYSLYKSRQEDVLHASGYSNWTIVRPAITFSKFRYQLVTLEAQVVVQRAMEGKTILLPEQAMDVQATMSWAGDVGKMFARLVLNPKAYGEVFSICTAEHHTWREIAEYYKEIIGLNYQVIDTEEFLQVWANNSWGARYQLLFDRCLDRVMDNSKILKATGMKQSDLTPIKEALAKELANLPADHVWPHSDTNDRMDAWLVAHAD